MALGTPVEAPAARPGRSSRRTLHLPVNLPHLTLCVPHDRMGRDAPRPRRTVPEPRPTPPSTEQLLLVNDEIAPRPLPVWRYLAAGAIMSAESRGVAAWRALRALPALLGMAIPVAALALVARVASGRPDEQVAAIAAISERADALLAVVPATADVVLVILLTALLIAVRGAFDALLYGRLRALASGVERPPAVRLRSGYLAHSWMALLSFGLYVGAIMFTSPIVRAMARVTSERAGTPEATVMVVVGVGIVFGAIAWVRLLTVLASCWIAWRPRFLAATLVAALTEPIRRIRVYGAVLLAWLVGHGAAVGIAALSLEALLGPDGRLLETIPPVAGFTLGAAAALGVVVTSWVECTLLVVVGHRLGEVDVSSARRVKSAPVAADEVAVGVGFVPPVPGAYVGSERARAGAAPSVVSWAALGHPPTALPWDLGGAASIGSADDVVPSATGRLEVVVKAAAAPGGAAPTLPPPASAATRPPPPASTDPTPPPPASAASTPPPRRASIGALASGELGRARYRTAAGGVEVAWRPTS